MAISRITGWALGLAIAMPLSASPAAQAQTDTTRRATSEQRIPIRKEPGGVAGAGQVTQRESAGEVRLPAATARIDSLEAVAASYRQRLDALEAANADLTSRSAATERLITALNDSLRIVHGELNTARAELTAVRSDLALTAARTAALADSLQWLNQRFTSFRNGSVFGNSGFYVGLGTGANFTTGELRTQGYSSALHLVLPIGWSKRGNLIGVRTQWGFQRLEGRTRSAFTNPDPEIYSGSAMVTLSFPYNSAKTNSIYLMGGGGVYQFHHVGASSSLAQSFPDIQASASKSETKFGLTGGVGAEWHILGATSLFAQSSFTSVSASGRNLTWIPLLVGMQLR